MPLNYTLKNGFKKNFFLQKASLKKKTQLCSCVKVNCQQLFLEEFP